MRNRVGILTLLSIILVFAILYLAVLPRDTSLTQLQQNGVIRIGYAVEAPYAFIGDDGDITGESPEVAKVIVSSLGITRIEWIQTDFDLLITRLLDHHFDVIAAGMFITPERAQTVRFSNPTFHVQAGLLVQSGNPLQLHSYQNIVDNHDARVAVISGAVEIDNLQAAGATDDQLVIVPDALTGRTAVTSGLADGLALSSVTIRWMAVNDASGVTEVAEPFTSRFSAPSWGYGGFVFRPDDAQLIDAWNTALAAYIGSPEHIKLISQFGFTTNELPGAKTAAEVLEQ